LQPESEDFLKITDYIPIGRANAILMNDLSVTLHQDPRTTRAMVQQAREKGAPICSDWENGGYYIPSNVEEARAYYRQQSARIKSARAALNGIKKNFERW